MTTATIALAAIATMGIGAFFGFWLASVLARPLITDAYLKGRRDSDENLPPP